MQPWRWWWWCLAVGALLTVSCSASDPTSSSTTPSHDQPTQATRRGGARQLWTDDTDWQVLQHAGRMLLASNLTGADSPNLNSSSSSTEGNSTALAVLDRAVQDAFAAAAQSIGLADPSPAMVRYYRVRATRIMLLLADCAWLVYATAGFAQRTFALLVPVIKVGQTGQLVLNVASVLVWAPLLADCVARFGDMIAKIFLVVFRSKILAATLPPAS